MAEVWIPDHQTGELHFCSQAMINDAGGRQLRLGMRKGLAPAGAVDVVLAASA
jgi:hypothetical protein